MRINTAKFISFLEKSILFHQTNQHDPHKIGNAVVASLTEVKNALESARESELEDALEQIANKEIGAMGAGYFATWAKNTAIAAIKKKPS